MMSRFNSAHARARYKIRVRSVQCTYTAVCNVLATSATNALRKGIKTWLWRIFTAFSAITNDKINVELGLQKRAWVYDYGAKFTATVAHAHGAPLADVAVARTRGTARAGTWKGRCMCEEYLSAKQYCSVDTDFPNKTQRTKPSIFLL